MERLNALKTRRDQKAVHVCLENIRQRAVVGENLMPGVLQAVTQFCTLGEIATTLRGVFGEWK
ncbi:MAG: hypothetical protein NVS9B7_09450 [Flavisolibacter sp.]